MKQFKRIWMVTLIVAMVMGQVGWAQDKAVVKPLSAEQVMELAKPYISSTTLALAYADAKRVDFVGLSAWVNQLVPKLKLPKEITQEKEFKAGVIMGPMMAEAMRGGFIAAGGRHILLVFNIPDTFREPTPLVIFPVEKGGNAATIASILRVPTLNKKLKENNKCTVFHQGAVLFGNAQDLRQIVAGKYQTDSRPQLLTAFKAVEDQQIQIVFNPYKDLRRVIDELMPNLPAQLGAEPTSTFTRGLRWTSVGINLSAKPEVKLINQSDSQTDAMALYRFLNRIPTLVEPNTRPDEKFLLDWLKQGIALAPEPVDSVMRTTLTTEQVEQNLVKAILPALAKARSAALQTQKMNQVRQLTLACILYANDHKDQWPTSLEQAIEGQKDSTQQFARIKMNEFVYHKPKLPMNKIKNHSKLIVIYEAYDLWPVKGICVGFADGHSELFRHKKDFEKQLGPKAKKDEQDLGKAKTKTPVLTKALRTKAMAAMKNLSVGCIAYATKKGHWPTALEQANEMLDNDDKMLINPRVISKSRGYIYIEPTLPMLEITNPYELILIYEDYDTWPTGGIGVLYMDNHGEIIRTEKELKKRLAIKAKKK